MVKTDIEQAGFPGVVLAIEKDGKRELTLIQGLRQLHPEPDPMSWDTRFDLASLTKPLSTAILVLHVCEQEGIGLEERIGAFMPEVSPQTREITIFQLLTHTSGLPPVPGIYRLFPREKDIDLERGLAHLFSLSPLNPPGETVVYSCTGFIFLAQILKRITALSLTRLFQEVVASPAGLKEIGFNLAAELRPQAAATEFCKWRRRWIRGEVHDENSFCLGQEGGNAGLFATAECILKLLELFDSEGCLGGRRILSAEAVSGMIRNQTGELSPHRSLGFLTQDADSFAGPGFSAESYGHTGFTGTSVWVDPVRRLKVVLLTNRVHLGREGTDERIKSFRRRLHQAVLKELG